MPLISIVIPIYNIEKYLKDCLDSVCKQTFNNYEVILVDDGSFDNCPKICDEYANKYDFIEVIHKENGGLVNARKSGTLIAKGDYIACVDGDDWIENNYIEVLTKQIEKDNSDIICFNYRKHRGNNKYDISLFEDVVYEKQDVINNIYPCLFQTDIMKCFNVSIWNKIYKTKLYKDIQLNIDDDVKIGEDGACSLPCIYKANKISFVSDYLYNYRDNSDSMTKGHKTFDLYGPVRIVKQWKKFVDIKEHEFDSQIDRFLVHQLFIMCISQFYNDKSYIINKESIIKAIESDTYSKAINNAKFKTCSLANIVKSILKNKCILLIYVISKFI